MNIARKLTAIVFVMSILLGSAQHLHAGVVIPPKNTEVSDSGLGTEYAGDLDVTSADGKLYAVWRDGRRTGSSVESDIYFASSADDGATWSQNRRVSNTDYVGFTDGNLRNYLPTVVKS